MDHFEQRLQSRIGITITKKQRAHIIAMIQSHSPGKVEYIGDATEKWKQWWQVEEAGTKFFVLYDSRKNKKCLLTCLPSGNTPIETLWETRAKVLQDIEFHKKEIERCNKLLDSISIQIVKQEAMQV